MRSSLPRWFAALPDALTAALFLVAWIAPQIPGPERVNHLLDSMPIEFIVMHSSLIYAGISASTQLSRERRLSLLAGMTIIYATFPLGFALADGSAWPLIAFGWLFISRFMQLWTHPLQTSEETARMGLLWIASALAYVFGAALTAKLPLPRLGMTPVFVASLHLTGSGEWIERPWTGLAFGALYFALLAWTKYGLAGVAAHTEGSASTSGLARFGTRIQTALQSRSRS